MSDCLVEERKKRIFIPCLQTICDVINTSSDMNFSASIMFEVFAQEKSKNDNKYLSAYKTYSITGALLEAFDAEWYRTNNIAARDALALIYAALKDPEFQSTLKPQESVFEKAKILLEDPNNNTEIVVVSNDKNIEKHRATIKAQDPTGNYDNISVIDSDMWLAKEIRGGNNLTLTKIIATKIRNVAINTGEAQNFLKNLEKILRKC